MVRFSLTVDKETSIATAGSFIISNPLRAFFITNSLCAPSQTLNQNLCKTGLLLAVAKRVPVPIVVPAEAAPNQRKVL